MTTQLVVEDSPSYRPGCVTNGRVWQPHEVTGIKVTVIKLTGDASRSQSSSSLPGRLSGTGVYYVSLCDENSVHVDLGTLILTVEGNWAFLPQS